MYDRIAVPLDGSHVLENDVFSSAPHPVARGRPRGPGRPGTLRRHGSRGGCVWSRRRSRRRTKPARPLCTPEDEIRVELTALAREFPPKAISSATRIIDQTVTDRWLIELAHQRLDRLTNHANRHRRRTSVIMALSYVAVIAMTAGALTQDRFWALTVVVAVASASAVHAADRCGVFTGARLLATLAAQQQSSRGRHEHSSVPRPSTIHFVPNAFQLREIRTWCLTNLAGVAALTSLSVVMRHTGASGRTERRRRRSQGRDPRCPPPAARDRAIVSRRTTSVSHGSSRSRSAQQVVAVAMTLDSVESSEHTSSRPRSAGRSVVRK